MISVCMATYNGEKYIRQQIESILAQLSKTDEIIVSDNYSTDKTVDIIRNIGDNRIKIYSKSSDERKHKYSNSHYLVTANFENALRYASGDYIFLSDQDDIWAKDKVSIIMPLLQKGHFVMTNYSFIDSDNNILKEQVLPASPINNGFLNNLIKLPFHGCCLAFPKSLLKTALPFPTNLIMHDAWLGLIAQRLGYNLTFINQPLTLYRRHDYNVSPTLSHNPVSFKILYRLKLLYQLLYRIFLKPTNN